jgi:hypothetical protein
MSSGRFAGIAVIARSDSDEAIQNGVSAVASRPGLLRFARNDDEPEIIAF